MSPNKITHYVDAKTGRYLYSIPFFDPADVYTGWPYKPGDKYKTYEEYLEEQENGTNQD